MEGSPMQRNKRSAAASVTHQRGRPGEIDHALAAVLQVEGKQCWALAVVADAGRDPEAGALDDRGPVSAAARI
jgi:hypothetical protein